MTEASPQLERRSNKDEADEMDIQRIKPDAWGE